MKDPILDELHATRERLLLDAGGTLAGLVARLKQEESESGRRLWEPRRTKSDIEHSDLPVSEKGSVPAPQ